MMRIKGGREMKAVNIIWDGNDDDTAKLPTEVELPDGWNWDRDTVSDWLVQYGYIPLDFDIVES